MELSGRSVVLTGVGRPGQVGEAVAEAFAERGARVFLIDRTDEHVRARADALVARGLRAAGLAADLTDAAAVSVLADRVRDATAGRLHALVHLAGGFSVSGPVAESDPAVWQRQFAINATTAYLTARAFLPLLRGVKGAFVCFASEAALPGARAGPAATLTSSDAPSWACSIGRLGCQKSSQTERPIRPSGGPTSCVLICWPGRVKRPSSNSP